MLKDYGVKVFDISPGMLATGLGGNPKLTKKIGALDLTLKAELICDVVEGCRNEDVEEGLRSSNVRLR